MPKLCAGSFGRVEPRVAFVVVLAERARDRQFGGQATQVTAAAIDHGRIMRRRGKFPAK